MYRVYGKRLLDLIVTIPLLVILAPVFGLLVFLGRINLGAPVFFQQQRPGQHGKIFTLLKFRTMTDARNIHGSLLSDADRLTAYGRFLRSTSLDELPTLLNVLKGEMSLVGPRPLLVRYLERYTPKQRRRHEVKPGITGWAQISGRNAIPWEEKFALDVWYVDHYSFWLDIKIVFITVEKVFKREGISQQNHVTMEEFLG